MSAHLPDDELLSALIDGEGTASERATTSDHARSCPACAERLAQLRAVAAAVSSPVAPSDGGRRQAALAAALATFTSGPTNDSVTPLPQAAPARRHIPAWALGAAALVLAVLVAVPLVVNRSDNKERTTTAAAPVPTDKSNASQSGASQSGASQSNAVPSEVGPPVAGGVPYSGAADLGDQADDAILARLVASGAGVVGAPNGVAARQVAPTAGAGAPATPAPAAAPTRCEAQAAAAAASDATRLRYAATLRWRGVPALVEAFDGGDGHLRAVVLSTAACAVLTAVTT
jgi:anti-sigma factor RsiW